MKMKNKTKNQVLWSTVVVLGLVLTYMWFNPKVVEVPVEVPVMPVPPRIEVERRQPRRSPEFRDAPIKQYKPGHMQQMGVLVGMERPFHSTGRRFGDDAIAIIITPQLGVKTSTHSRCPTTHVIVWRTLAVKNSMGMKQSQ
jgi:hypothetical protein